MNFVYILKCSDDSLYTGWTNDIVKRLKAHSAGKGAKYTRARLPVTLAYVETYESPIDAQKREFYIKKHLSRTQKQELIEGCENGYGCIYESGEIIAVKGEERIPITELK